MRKFCTKCGRELKDGEVCSCSHAAMKAAAPVASTSPAGEVFNKVVDVAKGIFVKPVTTMKKYIGEKNKNLGWILIAVAMIATGILGITLADALVAMVDSMTFGLGGSMMEVDSFEVFLYGALGAGLVYVVLAGAIYLIIAKAFGKNVTFGKVISMIGVVSMITAVATLLTALATFINGTLALIIYVLGSLFYSVNLYHGIKLVADLEDDRLAVTYVGANALVYVVLFVLMKIFG